MPHPDVYAEFISVPTSPSIDQRLYSPFEGGWGMIIRDVEKAEFDFINRSGATALSDVHWLRDPFQPLIP